MARKLTTDLEERSECATDPAVPSDPSLGEIDGMRSCFPTRRPIPIRDLAQAIGPPSREDGRPSPPAATR